MLITCINLSDLRPIIESATPAIFYGQKCFSGLGTVLPSKPNNFL